ncbi:MAG TPA: aspartate/glutamate racemase family protein [Casimicrobiaceae bacterium]|nr:aspartate/glutamate racemase family protein [Casimicrobiaceae bacterium]
MSADSPRIALIHALLHSVAPINEAFANDWPQAERMNLIDDSLSSDLAASPSGLDARMTARFIALAGYAIETGAQGILFTCSAFGRCIDAVKEKWPHIPVLKPNEAMIDEAVATGRRIGLIASFAPTLASMPAEFPSHIVLRQALASGALEALNRGDTSTHDRLVADAAASIANEVDVIALAQFSLARAAPSVSERTKVPVLTTPQSAVRKLREGIEGRAR